jgi:hypothetical protein
MCGGWFVGCAAKLHPSEGVHGAFILATITKDTKGGLHQLGSAQLGSSAALYSQMFGIFGSSAAYKIVNLLAAAWHIAARLSAARHFGSSTAWQLIGRSTARQLGSPAAS